MSNPISPTATSFRPSHRFGRLHHQLRPMAKRRLNPDEIRAAVEAGPPPHSVNYETDKKWHAAQNCWLAKWTERRLPDSGDSGSSRRDQWRDRKQQHARLLRAAEMRRASLATREGLEGDFWVDFWEVMPIERSRRALFGGVLASFFSHGKHF